MNKIYAKVRGGRLKMSVAVCALFAVTGATVAASAWPPAPAAAASPNGTCQAVTIPVALAASQPVSSQISATYCTPKVWAAGPHAADILMHGGSYDRSYFDFPASYPQYSFVDRTLQNGRATLAVDRLGAGASSHPVSTAVTVQADAYAMHQVLNWTRNVQHAAKINVVAHSLGSTVAIEEAAQYHDVASLAVTGLTHKFGAGFGILGASAYPAAADSQFAGKGYDPGYVTTRPGTRQQLFYSASANPQVIAYDEAHKDIFSTTEAAGAVAQVSVPGGTNRTNTITANVLVLLGGQDYLFCTAGGTDCSSSAALKAQEAPYYTAAPAYDAALVANTGHDLALHPSAGTSFSRINSWFQR